MGVRDTTFNLNHEVLKALVEGEATSFLGAQVGFRVIPKMATLEVIIETGLKIVRSMLAPWQRIDALKTFFYPSAVHLQRMWVFPKTDWAKVNKTLRPEIKATLNHPQETSNEYIYGSTKAGCCGLTSFAEDTDITAVDSVFKLLTSPDGRVARDASDHVREVTENYGDRLHPVSGRNRSIPYWLSRGGIP